MGFNNNKNIFSRINLFELLIKSRNHKRKLVCVYIYTYIYIYIYKLKSKILQQNLKISEKQECICKGLISLICKELLLISKYTTQ